MRRSGLKAQLLAAVLAAVAVLAAAYAVSLARSGADVLLTQAVHGTNRPVRAAARAMLGRYDECPVGDFSPTTPIGLLIAAWDDTVATESIEPLLDRLLDANCDINRRGAQGLAPLHSAILFNNADAVRLLLRAGADPALLTRIPRDDGGFDEFDAFAFASRLAATTSAGAFEDVRTVLSHARQVTAPNRAVNE